MAEAVSGPSSIALTLGSLQQLGDQRAERMPAMHVVGPVRGDHGKPLGVQHPAQEGQ